MASWTAGGYPTVRGLDPAGGPYLGEGGQFGNDHHRGDFFALTPPPLTNVCFADGSVRSMTAAIGPSSSSTLVVMKRAFSRRNSLFCNGSYRKTHVV